MFERSFAWAMRHGSRLLFAAACVMLIIGILGFGMAMMQNSGSLPPGNMLTLALQMAHATFAPAAYLLFGAILIERIRRDA